MSDVHRLGPYGEGGESPPVTVDLTRIDIRRGTLYLPRRFYDALPAGELSARDTVGDHQLTVKFQPPRQLEGLDSFFEEHELRPNDAVSLLLGDELRLTPIRRERRQEPAATSEQAAARPSAGSGPATPASGQEAQGGWQDVLHDPAPRSAGVARSTSKRENSGGDEGQEQPARVTAAQRPIDVGGGEPWHESPRDLSRLGGDRQHGEAADRAGREGRERFGAEHPHGERPRREQWHGEQATGARPRGEQWPGEQWTADRWGSDPIHSEPEIESLVRERPRQEAGNDRQPPRPLAPEADVAQRGLFEEQRDETRLAGRHAPEHRRTEPSAETRPTVLPSSEPYDRRVEEPVAVGAGAAGAGDVVGRIASYLQDPATPAIVRATSVAEQLGVPLEETRQGLAEVSRKSEGSVTSIRQDVYLVKRGG